LSILQKVFWGEYRWIPAMAKSNLQIRMMAEARGRASFDSLKMAEIIYER
jgi:hypothetical protein